MIVILLRLSESLLLAGVVLGLTACSGGTASEDALDEPGVRLVYSFDFEKAAEAGLIDPAELADQQKLLLEMADVCAQRVEACGLEDVPVVPQGDDRILIEIPVQDAARLHQLKSLMRNSGMLEFLIVASDEDGIELAAERAKFEAWLEAKPAENPLDFNGVAVSAGGPRAEIRWTPLHEKALDHRHALGAVREYLPLLVQSKLRLELAGGPSSWDFRSEDLAYAGPSIDQSGLPAVAFEFKESRKAAFSDFTEAYVNRTLAIVINQKVFTAPNINDRLPGAGIIMGGRQGFSQAERDELIHVLRSGPMRVLPTLQSESPVQPK